MRFLYIVNNGIYHKCTSALSIHCLYTLENDYFICDVITCLIRFPSILAISFPKIKHSIKWYKIGYSLSLEESSLRHASILKI